MYMYIYMYIYLLYIYVYVYIYVYISVAPDRLYWESTRQRVTHMLITVMCYKLLSVVRHESDNKLSFPTSLGPVFLHDNSDFETHYAFFHNLK